LPVNEVETFSRLIEQPTTAGVAGAAHSGALAPLFTDKTCPAVPIPKRAGVEPLLL
jgi:hypothetical protein